jgi:hypothetical protein
MEDFSLEWCHLVLIIHDQAADVDQIDKRFLSLNDELTLIITRHLLYDERADRVAQEIRLENLDNMIHSGFYIVYSMFRFIARLLLNDLINTIK